MAKLWVFGDSFSDGITKTIKRYNSYSEEEWETYKPNPQHSYFFWKQKQKGKIPTHFEDIVAEHFGIEEIRNEAVGGYCNDDIIESIGNYIDKIEEDDVVIIGWTDPARTRFIDTNKQWTIMHPATVDNPTDWLRGRGLSQKGKQGIIEMLVLRMEASVYYRDTNIARYWKMEGHIDPLEKQLLSYAKILNKSLPKNTLHWTWCGDENHNLFYHPTYVENEKLPTISKETDERFSDGHYSETALIELGKMMINWFKEPKRLYPNLYNKPI